MKEYIFITYDIHFVGGVQSYTASKIQYIEENTRWKPYVFFSGSSNGSCAFQILDKYLRYSLPGIDTRPYIMKEEEVYRLLDRICDVLVSTNGERDEIVIESHYDVGAYWGELLAERLRARHLFIGCNETYRDENRYYIDNLPFFYFKWKRKELLIDEVRLRKLFNGYKNVDKISISFRYPPIREMDAVQDVKNKNVEELIRLSWNICYIGRAEKQYVEFIIKAVKIFANNHKDKEIQFIMVGNANNRLEMIHNELSNVENVKVALLGDLIPIPRSLFQKIDVVIAGAGAAWEAAYEKIPVILTHAEMPWSTGVLGYETLDVLYGTNGKRMPYEEVLEDVLLNKLYNPQECKLPIKIPSKKNHQYFFYKIKKIIAPKKYCTDNLIGRPIESWVMIFPFSKIRPNSRIIIYGYGKVGKDYVMQVNMQHYCTIEAIVDKDYDSFDNDVKSPMILKELLYDYIVIAVFSKDKANEIIAFLSEIVPNDKKKIVYTRFVFQLRR